MSDGPTCLLALRRIPPAGTTIVLRATPAECLALAGRFDLPAIARLEGRFTLQPEPGGGVAATLELTAEITQISVVSLEPFAVTVHEAARLRFVPAEETPDDDLIDPTAPDEIPYSAETLDLGAALTEQLALALDPYPRRPDEAAQAAPAAAESQSAFTALARLRRDPAKR
jgi:uncharacterized metal-binding protein YceD (DUF177 family)